MDVYTNIKHVHDHLTEISAAWQKTIIRMVIQIVRAHGQGRNDKYPGLDPLDGHRVGIHQSHHKMSIVAVEFTDIMWVTNSPV